jgi:hypothetical protein
MPVPSSCFQDSAKEVDRVSQLSLKVDLVFGVASGQDLMPIAKNPTMLLRQYSMSMPVCAIFSVMEHI